jgi:hypothetical protein
MNKEKQRIAIAEACGWKPGKCPCGEDSCNAWKTPAGDNWEYLPDYLSDLNAMHEAEKVLTIDQLIDQAAWLGASSNEMMIKSWVILLRANAAQRAEAFLKTIDKWEDDK